MQVLNATKPGALSNIRFRTKILRRLGAFVLGMVVIFGAIRHSLIHQLD
jgi:hypothetical protein